MWQERIKGLIVILLLGGLAFGVVRYVAVHQEELAQGKINISPEKVQSSVLGVVNEIKRRAGGEPIDESIDPVGVVEEKATELLEEIKGLPQEQAEAVKKRIWRQLCQEVMENEFSSEELNDQE